MSRYRARHRSGARAGRARYRPSGGGAAGHGAWRRGDRGHRRADRGAAARSARREGRRARQDREAGPGAARRPADDRRAAPSSGAAEAGLRGIAVEAGASLVVDRAAIAAAADARRPLRRRHPRAVSGGAAHLHHRRRAFGRFAGRPADGGAEGAHRRERALCRHRRRAMAARGLASRVPLADLAIMGVAEVLPRARRIFRIVRARRWPTCWRQSPTRW